MLSLGSRDSQIAASWPNTRKRDSSEHRSLHTDWRQRSRAMNFPKHHSRSASCVHSVCQNYLTSFDFSQLSLYHQAVLNENLRGRRLGEKLQILPSGKNEMSRPISHADKMNTDSIQEIKSWETCGTRVVLIHLITRGDQLFYNSAITKPVECACILVEIGSHNTKMVTVQSHNFFLTKSLEKSLCDFTGTIFVQCHNPVLPSQLWS